MTRAGPHSAPGTLVAGESALPETLGKAFADYDTWTEATGARGRYSLVTRERADGVSTGYYVHWIVQQAMRDRQNTENTGAQWLGAACDLVNAAFPLDSGLYSEARDFCELALESALRQFGPDHPHVAVSRSNLAAILYSLGTYDAALREIDQALEIFRKKLPPGHPYIRKAEGWREDILGAGATDS